MRKLTALVLFSELRGGDAGGTAGPQEDNEPFEKGTVIDNLTEDDYFRKNAEVPYQALCFHLHSAWGRTTLHLYMIRKLRRPVHSQVTMQLTCDLAFISISTWCFPHAV